MGRLSILNLLTLPNYPIFKILDPNNFIWDFKIKKIKYENNSINYDPNFRINVM